MQVLKRSGAFCDQVHTLLKGLEKIAASADIPMLVAGDFNSVPGRLVASRTLYCVLYWREFSSLTCCGTFCSAPHCLLSTGRVDPAHPDLQVDPLNILRPPSKLFHSLPLVST